MRFFLSYFSGIIKNSAGEITTWIVKEEGPVLPAPEIHAL